MPEMDRSFDSRDMARRGAIGGKVTASRHGTRQTTEAARRTFIDSFAKAVDPDGVLTPQEPHRRGEAARRAHYLRLARLSAIARSRRSDKAAV